jgi:hypothetical protein
VTTLQTLKTYYSDILRVSYNAIPSADAALLTTLSTSVDNGGSTLAAAQAAVARLAINTTSVAVLSYQFFTGATLRTSGLDYLISPQGANANNLNAAYYQAFNIENRYINFAVNLAVAGEGAVRFAQNYGALTLRDAVAKAYGEIFGVTATSAKLDELLNVQVPNGAGGTITRAQYFALYGHDGVDGVGTKAAAIGWLLAQAAKEDTGTYAKANDAFLADLGPDGVALFHTDLIAAYGPPAAAPTPGATIAMGTSQSVSTTASDSTLKSTDLADTITASSGVGAGQSLLAGKGVDTITLGGTSYGQIQTADGGDTVTIASLGSTTATLGVPSQSGSVQLLGGGDTVRVTGTLAAGTSITAEGVGNSLYLGGTPTADSSGVIPTGTISGFQTIYVQSPDAMRGVNVTGGLEVVYDAVGAGFAAGSNVTINQATNGLTVLKDTAYGVTITYPSVGVDALPSGQYVQRAGGTTVAQVHLDHFTGAPTTVVSANLGSFGSYSANGGSITVRGEAIQTVELSIDSNSTAGMIAGVDVFRTGSIVQSFSMSAYVPNLVIKGVGSLTAQISTGFANVDASAAGDFNLTYAGAPGSFLFSSGTDTLRIELPFSGATASKIVFGSGVDTLIVSGSSFANLNITNSVVDTPPQIFGFKAGVDHLVLDGLVTGVTVSVQQYADGAPSLSQALIQVSAHVAAGSSAVFTFGGDTYVYHQDATVGVNMVGAGGGTGDGLIKLVGVTGLSLATGAAVGDIHFG